MHACICGNGQRSLQDAVPGQSSASLLFDATYFRLYQAYKQHTRRCNTQSQSFKTVEQDVGKASVFKSVTGHPAIPGHDPRNLESSGCVCLHFHSAMESKSPAFVRYRIDSYKIAE